MGFVKINTDGARDPDTKMAAIGVVIRDMYGHYIALKAVNIASHLILRLNYWLFTKAYA